MNDEATRWVFGILITALGAGFLILLGKADNLRDALGKVDTRMTKLETIFSLMGDKAATILHSPHTPALDRLLEKYLDRNYELTPDEWKELVKICDEIEADTNKPKDQRALAAIVSAVCNHKLMQLPPQFKKHYDV